MALDDLVGILLRETEHDNTTHHVLGLIKERVDPIIKQMSRQELEDMLSDAVYALYQKNCSEYVLDDNLRHFEEESASWNSVAGLLQTELEIAPKRSSKNATDAKYEQDRKRGEEIKKIWASGKYSNKSICADEEWEGLGFNSKKTARNKLDKEPDPSPWPAKENVKKIDSEYPLPTSGTLCP